MPDGTARQQRLRTRWIAAAVLLGCAALLGAAGALRPDAAGLGTHTQLGFAACPWHARHGVACPSCGMTTAFSLAARGHLLQAAYTQPAGAIGALLTAGGVWIAGYALVTGCPIGRWLRPLWRPRTVAAVTIVLLAAWAYKAAIPA